MFRPEAQAPPFTLDNGIKYTTSQQQIQVWQNLHLEQDALNQRLDFQTRSRTAWRLVSACNASNIGAGPWDPFLRHQIFLIGQKTIETMASTTAEHFHQPPAPIQARVLSAHSLDPLLRLDGIMPSQRDAKQKRRLAMQDELNAALAHHEEADVILSLAGRIMELAAGTPCWHNGSGRLVPLWLPDVQRLGGEDWNAELMSFCVAVLLIMAQVLSAGFGKAVVRLWGEAVPGTGAGAGVVHGH
ncbi:hypothetical protein LTR36_010220 [Oleoguttula mirabilis]|uniref:Uncharacterized protein n=1 Tax=Oleoguttula mirabilis TaxID=1507867 RepID=A0AAV9JSB6_9PEZI|nr:hypothetical protein LTR36_010220 [Oleoguttula mirabilis]